MNELEIKGNDLLTKIKLISLEYWNALLKGLPVFIGALIVILFGLFLAFKLSKFVKNRLSAKVEDRLLISFIEKAIRLTLIVITFMLAFQIMGYKGVAGGLLAGAGISAFIIGFAFKDIAENFLAGIILAFNRPFHINDAVIIKEFSGKVIGLDLRVTHVKTFDGKDVFIPNSTVIKEVVTNLTRDGFVRMEFVVGIDYSNNIDNTITLITNCMRTVEGLDKNEEPFVAVDDLGINTVNLKAYFWIRTDDYKKGALILRSKVIARVKNKLLEEGYNLPANIQEIKLHNDQKNIPLTILNIQEQNGI